MPLLNVNAGPQYQCPAGSVCAAAARTGARLTAPCCGGQQQCGAGRPAEGGAAEGNVQGTCSQMEPKSVLVG
eukprot:1136803-Pelagomonas_calceolata.AAC.12